MSRLSDERIPELPREPVHQRDGQTDNVVIITRDFLDQQRAESLNPVRARFVHGLAGRYVPIYFVLGEAGEIYPRLLLIGGLPAGCARIKAAPRPDRRAPFPQPAQNSLFLALSALGCSQ